MTDDLRTRWTLRDLGTLDGSHYAETGTPEDLAGYLDGPVRDSLTHQVDTDDLGELIQAFRDHDLIAARRRGAPFSIYVSEAVTDDE